MNVSLTATRTQRKIAVVIPCFRVRKQILDVIGEIGREIDYVFVVDDDCPQNSGRLVQESVADPRVQVLFHDENKGVGGAVMTGYRAALETDADVVVKLDGDGQMDPTFIRTLIQPILEGRADYAKGNRFHSAFNVRQMPSVRLFGNAILSLLTKLSSGYWSIFDPTNGFTAIHRESLKKLELSNVSERYFFESDMLINLGNLRAVVVDVPMEAKYADEESNLKIRKIMGEFLIKNFRELFKRVLYNYFLRDFSIASTHLVFGFALTGFGVVFGSLEWARSIDSGQAASTGTVMIATLPIILGFQLLLNFLSVDIGNEPRIPLQPRDSFAVLTERDLRTGKATKAGKRTATRTN